MFDYITTTSCEISKPIKVKIYFENDLYFVENKILILTGIGKTENLAIKNFCNHVCYFYKYYNKLSTDEITGDSIRLKQIYNNLF